MIHIWIYVCLMYGKCVINKKLMHKLYNFILDEKNLLCELFVSYAMINTGNGFGFEIDYWNFFLFVSPVIYI